MDAVITFLYLLFMSGNLTIVFRKKIEEVIPFTIMISGVVLYLTAFFGKLDWGFYLLVVVSLCFPFVLIIKKENRLYLKNILTPGFLVFVVLYVEICVLNWNRGFTQWDEFSHWGPMVKETLRLNTFYSNPASQLSVHKDYPPAIVLVEVLWCKLEQVFGGYSESALYRALQTFILSLYIPAFKGIKWSDKVHNIIAAVLSATILFSLQLIMPLGEAKIYATIYIDGAMAVLFAYCVYLVISNTHISAGFYVQISVALSYLLLTKQMALPFYLLTIAVFVLNILIHSDLRKQILCVREGIKAAVSLILVPFAFSGLWNLYIKKLGIVGQFSISSIQVGNLLDIINGNGGMEWQHTAYLNFVDKFCNTKLKVSPLPLSYWALIIVLGMLLFFVGRLSKNLLLRRQIYSLDVCMILGGFAYAGAIMLTYIYAFSEYEGVRTVCYARYMGTYTFAFFALIIMIFVSRWWAENCERISLKKLAAIMIVILLALLPTKNIQYLVPIFKDNSAAADLKLDEQIIKYNTEEDAKIYLISQWNNGYDKFRLSYLTLPRTYNSKGYSLGEKYYDEDAWTQNLDSEIWQESLRDYDYLYLKHIDEQFINKYGFAFEEDSDLHDGQIYKIVKENNGEIVLKLLDTIEL